MIVVDTNIIAYLYLSGEYTDQVDQLYRYDANWAAPILWRSEFRNVLTMYIRKKILTYQSALEIMKKAEVLMEGNEYSVDSVGVMECVSNSSCTAYDCEFVYLAQELGVPLITEDKKVLNAFPVHTISLSDIYSTLINKKFITVTN
jgi:predicted nucleic acid-binding protein